MIKNNNGCLIYIRSQDKQKLIPIFVDNEIFISKNIFVNSKETSYQICIKKTHADGGKMITLASYTRKEDATNQLSALQEMLTFRVTMTGIIDITSNIDQSVIPLLKEYFIFEMPEDEYENTYS